MNTLEEDCEVDDMPLLELRTSENECSPPPEPRINFWEPCLMGLGGSHSENGH
jgi:hypothetical protein